MRKFVFKVPRDDPEDQLQRQIVALLDAAGVLYCHVPNGGRTSKREGGKRKRRGVKAGVPDLLIFDTPRNLPRQVRRGARAEGRGRIALGVEATSTAVGA